jgi:hypothetical protein
MQRNKRARMHNLLNRKAYLAPLFRALPTVSRDPERMSPDMVEKAASLRRKVDDIEAKANGKGGKANDLVAKSPSMHVTLHDIGSVSSSLREKSHDIGAMSHTIREVSHAMNAKLPAHVGVLRGVLAMVLAVADRLFSSMVVPSFKCVILENEDQPRAVEQRGRYGPFVVRINGVEYPADDRYLGMILVPKVHELLRPYLFVQLLSREAQCFIAFLLAYARLVLGQARRRKGAVRSWTAALADAFDRGPLGSRPPPALFV